MTTSQQLNALENEKSCIEFLQRARMHLAKGMNWDDGDRFAWIVLTNAINKQIWGWMEEKFFIPEIQFGDCVAKVSHKGESNGTKHRNAQEVLREGFDGGSHVGNENVLGGVDGSGEGRFLRGCRKADGVEQTGAGSNPSGQPLITIFPERRAIVKTREERK